MQQLDQQKIKEVARAYLMNAGLTDAQIKKLEEKGYFTAPASMRHHLNVPGGLAEHSIHVTQNAIQLGAFHERRSAYRFGMLHDLVKMLCYKPSKTGKGYSYVQPAYPGHGVCSALIAADLGIYLTEEERCAIVWHMGAFNLSEDELKEYHSALKAFPRQLILSHAADHLSSAFGK